jgi:hypothetical protein
MKPNRIKTNSGFVYEEIIKWVAIIGGGGLLIFGLFKYQAGLYADIAQLEANQKTLETANGEQKKEIKFLKELDASNQETIKTLKEAKGAIDVKTQVVYRDKIKVIEGINNNPNLLPQEKKALKSEVQIDSVWQSFCEVAGIVNPGCAARALTEEKK